MTAIDHREAPGPRFFSKAAHFRAWLQRHAASETSLLVGYFKVGSGQPSMTWPESVDEALCVGWIDGVRKRIDDTSYQIRFTPRKAGSIWSTVNIAKVQALTAQGRMQPAGLAAFARLTAPKARIYAYEQAEAATLSPAEQRAFQRRKAAWRYFMEDTPPSYRKACLHWVVSAKQQATRVRRLERLMAACQAGEKLAR